MIIKSRSHLGLVVDGRPVSVPGEAFHPGYGSPQFVVYAAMMKKWDDGSPLSVDDKRKILAQVRREATEQKLDIEIEDEDMAYREP